MANTLKVKRGFEANRGSQTPAAGEPLWATDTKKLYVGDGSTAGGISVSYTHPNHSGDVTSTGDGATVLTVSGITGKTALTTGLAGTDELLVSDGGVLKRMDVSVMNAYFNANLSFNNYTHPSDGVDLGAALTGANVISDVNVNAAGHVTGFATRALTLANLGYTGAVNAEVNPAVVGQAEAEAGTATTERTWTAQRVAQAIAAQAGGGGGLTTTGVKTAAYTAVAGDRVLVNTTGGAVTITLPASPSAGDQVGFIDYLRTWGTNNLTVGRNSQDIENIAQNMTVSDPLPFTLEYIDATVGWKLI